MGAALILNGYWIINKIIYAQYESSFSMELKNLVVEVQQARQTLENAGILDLPEYVALSQQKVIEKFKNYHFGKTGYFYLFDQDGKVVYHPHAQPGMPGILGLEPMMLKHDSGSIIFDYREQTEFGYYRQTGVWGWTALVAIQQDEMFVIRDTYMTFVVSITGVSFVLLIIMTRILQNNISTRIENTLSKLRQMAQGEYNTRFEIGGKDEVSEIESAINTLITQIEREINQRKKSEQALISAKELADQASRVKSEFLSTMSHEIRTPMNGVMGGVQLLEKTDCTKAQSEYIGVINHSSAAMMYVIDQILDFSRLDSGKMALESNWFCTDTLVEGLMDLFSYDCQAKNIKFCMECLSDTDVQYKGDANRIRQVLMNLIGNAVKFTQTGKIVISVFETDKKQEGRAELCFKVTDSGIGIEENQLESLFDSFVQADASIARKYGGSGLGLSICKRLVEAMEGSISVKSELGQGSTFQFQIALEKRSNPQAMPSNAVDLKQALDAPELKLSILIAEDIVPNQLIARKILERQGHEVTIVDNGVKAVDAVALARYDVVLMDINMPEMDGITATERIRGLQGPGSRTPIIAMTADARQENYQACLAAGMNAFVSKPIRVTKLNEALASVGTDKFTE